MEEKLVSRRGFIMGAAAAATGAALLGSPLALAATDPSVPAVGTWPWPAEGLDPDKVGARAWSPDSACKGCGDRSTAAMILELQEVVGSPWTLLPITIGAFANGGGPYGTACGGVAGPYFIMTLVGAHGALGQQYHKWYCDFPFPSTDWDDLTTFTNTVQSVSGSPLCHESRTQWENVYLKQWDRTTPYDGTRCRKLPCDTVKKAVQMLNDWKSGTVPPAWAPDDDYASCYSCHTQLWTDKQVGAIDPNGRENCTNCHTVSTKHPAPAKKPTRKKKTVK